MINAPKAAGVPQAPPAPQQAPQPQKRKAEQEAEVKPEAKPSEPEMIVIPLEEMEQQPKPQQKAKRSS